MGTSFSNNMTLFLGMTQLNLLKPFKKALGSSSSPSLACMRGGECRLLLLVQCNLFFAIKALLSAGGMSFAKNRISKIISRPRRSTMPDSQRCSGLASDELAGSIYW